MTILVIIIKIFDNVKIENVDYQRENTDNVFNAIRHTKLIPEGY